MTQNKAFSWSSIFAILLFAAPKKKTSKSKTNSRFAHWFNKPQSILKKLVSAGKKKIQTLPKKALGFGQVEKKQSAQTYEKKKSKKTKILDEPRKTEE